MIVAIYARVTEKEGREKLSQQIITCQQYAHEQGYKTRESFIYEDIAPDDLDPELHPDKYPDLHRLIKDARTHRFSVIVVKHPSSFCCDIDDMRKIVTTLFLARVGVDSIYPFPLFPSKIPSSAPQHLIDTLCWK